MSIDINEVVTNPFVEQAREKGKIKIMQACSNNYILVNKEDIEDLICDLKDFIED